MNEHAFIVRAKALATQAGLTQAKAVEALARSNPALYNDWRDNLGTDSASLVQASGSPCAADEHSFTVQANELAKEQRISIVQASEQLARSNPALYASWRDREETTNPAPVRASARLVQSCWNGHIKSMMDASGLTQEEAGERLARSNPDFYAAYRDSLGEAVLAKEAVAASPADAGMEHPFTTKYKALAKQTGITESQAYATLAKSDPELYAAYWKEI